MKPKSKVQQVEAEIFERVMFPKSVRKWEAFSLDYPDDADRIRRIARWHLRQMATAEKKIETLSAVAKANFRARCAEVDALAKNDLAALGERVS